MTDISRENVEALAKDCTMAQNCLAHDRTFPTGQGILEDATNTLLALRAEVDALEQAQAPDISALRNHGFAPGSYHCFCSECGKTHTADKRAWRCLECAEKHVEAKLAERVTVKPLVEAMEDLLGEARGVLPESADAFYDYKRGEFTEARILSAIAEANGREGGE